MIDNAVAPILSSKALARFCETEGFDRPKRLAVIPALGAQVDHCYPNVERQVALYGGSTVHGYKIIEFPKLMLQAIHHAVWQDRKGRMIDVTPDERKWRTVVFCCAIGDKAADGRGSPSALPRFMNMSGLKEVDEAISASLRLTRMRLAGALPNGMLPQLDPRDPEVARLLSEARALICIAQAKVGVS